MTVLTKHHCDATVWHRCDTTVWHRCQHERVTWPPCWNEKKPGELVTTAETGVVAVQPWRQPWCRVVGGTRVMVVVDTVRTLGCPRGNGPGTLHHLRVPISVFFIVFSWIFIDFGQIFIVFGQISTSSVRFRTDFHQFGQISDSGGYSGS